MSPHTKARVEWLKGFALFSMLIACSTNSPEHKKVLDNPKAEIVQIDPNITVDFKSSTFFNHQKLVPLSSPDSITIGEIKKVIPYKNRIYSISHSKKSAVMIFDEKGHLQKQISMQMGETMAPASIEDILVDPGSGTLEVLDRSNKRIVIFDLMGNFIEASQINIWALSFAKHGGLYAFYCGNEFNGNVMDKLVYMKKGSPMKPLTTYFRIDRNRSRYLHLMDNNNFSFSQGQLSLMYAFADTIFRISPDRVEPRIAFDFGEFRLNDEIFNASHLSIAAFMSEVRRTHKAFYLNGLFEGQTYLLSSFEFEGRRYHLLYNKVEHKVHIINNYIEDLIFNGLPIESAGKNMPRGANPETGELAFVIEPLDAIEYCKNAILLASESQSDLTQLLASLSVDSNPIVVLRRLK
jgi:hypothetical protein